MITEAFTNRDIAMVALETDLETLLARQIAVSLAVQALIESLLLAGVLTPPDLVQLREFGLQWVDHLKQYGSNRTQIDGSRLDAEIREWWDPMGVPARMERLANAKGHCDQK